MVNSISNQVPILILGLFGQFQDWEHG